MFSFNDFNLLFPTSGDCGRYDQETSRLPDQRMKVSALFALSHNEFILNDIMQISMDSQQKLMPKPKPDEGVFVRQIRLIRWSGTTQFSYALTEHSRNRDGKCGTKLDNADF